MENGTNENGITDNGITENGITENGIIEIQNSEKGISDEKLNRNQNETKINEEPTRSINKESKLITELREKFLNHYNQQGNNELYDECDYEKVKKSDWTVKRFLWAKHWNIELAFENLCHAMQWRKSFRVNQLTDDYFPIEFYELAAIFQYQTDNQGSPMLFFRICVHHKIKELKKFVEEFIVHNFNKIDNLAQDKQWILIMDSSDSGLSNLDLDLSRFLTQILTVYFPKGFKFVVIYDLPWIMSTFWKITSSWISNEIHHIIKFANKQQIFDYIDAENVPEYIPGGKCTKDICFVPDGVKSAEQLPHLKHFTQEQLNNFRAIFKLPIKQQQQQVGEPENDETKNDDNVK